LTGSDSAFAESAAQQAGETALAARRLVEAAGVERFFHSLESITCMFSIAYKTAKMPKMPVSWYSFGTVLRLIYDLVSLFTSRVDFFLKLLLELPQQDNGKLLDYSRLVERPDY
jgi:hypothetical protein